jgi:hypothetical protein
MAKASPSPPVTVRTKLRQAAKDSGLTLEDIGLRMGYSKGGARQAVSRLLGQEDYDPRLSTLISFAEAVGKPLFKLLS